ncbi:unnamed protein product [Paramecium sonneborni]|uniref:Uncharacterized protein n=1 Tax=Paramecium sonneborni TaxID=65129 RepID=A0A8S1RUF9_9CILI|nr:unnamed protein product [Paramecium sonneborni]
MLMNRSLTQEQIRVYNQDTGICKHQHKCKKVVETRTTLDENDI